jgi:hypothetical protein
VAARPLNFTVRLLVKRLLLLGALVTFVVGAWAEPPPPNPFEAENWPPSLRKEPTKGITLGAFRVQFETTTLGEVQHAAASGSIAQQGDAAGHILWLCYTSMHSGAIERIWIISHGEMGGPDHAVTEFVAQSLKGDGPTVGCPLLPSKLQPVSLDISVWLGSTESDLDRSLGPPSHSDGAWRSYDFQTKLPGHDCDGDGYDLGSWLVSRSQGGRVTAISAGQVSSC